jgi:hypothetical protein
MKRKDDRHATNQPRLQEREADTPSVPDADAKLVVQLLPGGGLVLHYPMVATEKIGLPVAARVFEQSMVPGPSEIQ